MFDAPKHRDASPARGRNSNLIALYKRQLTAKKIKQLVQAFALRPARGAAVRDERDPEAGGGREWLPRHASRKAPFLNAADAFQVTRQENPSRASNSPACAPRGELCLKSPLVLLQPQDEESSGSGSGNCFFPLCSAYSFRKLSSSGCSHKLSCVDSLNQYWLPSALHQHSAES